VRLRDALRQARIEAADRTGVVVDLRDAEVARLEILNEALDPGISQGLTPRLWIDVVAHVVMGRDKRIYRFVQDTRYGRKVLAESRDVPVIVKAVTDYIARRMVERERALATTEVSEGEWNGKRRRGGFWPFVLGFIVGAAALFALALYSALHNL
jgi:hypothetical protein